MNLTAVF